MGADFIGELIDTYLSDTVDGVAGLRQALQAGDAPVFGRLAHSIKSTSASMGAAILAAQARELEMMGKAGDLAGAAPKVDALAAGFDEVRRRLEELRNEP
jgi:HPt (histidine-containing phosphotransfer) domain-containing protein